MDIFNFKEGEQHLFYFFGRPNCGKSYTAGELLKKYHKQFPNNKIIYIGPHTLINKETNKPEIADDSITYHIDKKYIYTMNMTEFFKNPLDVQRLKLAKNGSIVLFDDIDAYPPKKRKIINLVKDQILKQGRAHNKELEHNIDAIITGHTSLDYNNTKPVMENCNYIVFFNGTPKKQIYETLKKFFDDETINRIYYKMINNPNEYKKLLIHLNYPMYFITNNKKYLLQ